ncbi:unnamed protein product [Urochloa humidicola]
MASAGGEDEPGLFVKQGRKLHSKMLSKEAAAQLAVPSFRVYYSVASAGAVPFLWESQPGTPKNDSPAAAALPPLTPPPSYYSAGRGGAGGRSRKRRPGLFGSILPRMAFLRRPGRTAPCSSWSSSSWSSSSSNTSSMSPVFAVQSSSPAAIGSRGRHRRAFSAGAGAGDAELAAPPYFWEEERECCEKGVVKGCGVAVAVRNALATVVGGHRATTAA